MRFEQGNPERLEGKVLVYASLCKSDEPRSICGVYITHDLNDLKARSGAATPTEVLDSILKKWYVQKSDDLKDVLPLYGTRAQMDLNDLLSLTCDMLFVGKFSAPDACEHATKLGAEYYVVLLEDQLRNRKAAAPQSAAPQAPAKPQHTDIEPEEFSRYIMREYVMPLMHELQSGTENGLAKLKESFRTFSAGAHFRADVDGFCDALVFGKAPHKELMDVFYQKILAVHDENFTLAAQLRDKIALHKQEPAK